MNPIRHLELIKSYITGMKSAENSVENRVLDIVIKRIDWTIEEMKKDMAKGDE
jgi:hypothetical protein